MTMGKPQSILEHAHSKHEATNGTRDLRRHYEFLPSLVKTRMILQPSDVCLTSSSEEYDYRTFWDLVCLNADRFVHQDVGSGSRVAILSETSPSAIIGLFAILRAGAIAIPLNWPIPESRLRSIATTSRLTHILDLSTCEGHELRNIAQLSLVLDTSCDSSVQIDKSIPRNDPQSPALVIYTSGSTGEPKGVVHSHSSLSTMALAAAEVLCLGPGQRNFLFASFGWSLNIVDTIASLAAGACLCIPSNGEKSQGLERAICSFKATRTSLPASVLATMEPANVPSLTQIVIGGEPARSETIHTWSKYARLHWNFGSSETGMILAGNAMQHRNGGYMFPSCHCYLVSENGQEVPKGEIGQMVVEGQTNFMGYLKDGQISKTTRASNGSAVVHTGDLFQQDKDDGAFIHVGRIDFQLKIRGQRFEPEEVEHQMWKALSDVSELSVTAGKLKGSKGQPAVVVVVVPTAQSNGLKLSSALIKCSYELLLDTLPLYMIPIGALVVAKLPRLPNGKLDRKGLKEMVEQAPITDLVDLRSQTRKPELDANLQMVHILKDVWSNALAIDIADIQPFSNFFLLGGSSIDAMKACKLLFNQGIRTSIATFFSYPTFDAMVQIISQQANVRGKDLRGRNVPVSAASKNLIEEVSSIAARDCGIGIDRIEDVYMCTPIQIGLMSTAEIHEGTYTAEHSFRLPRQWLRERFIQAWLNLVKVTPILRSRIVQLGNGQPVNVTLCFDEALALPIEGVFQPPKMGSASAMFVHGLREDCETNALIWTWHVHHAILDRWSTNLILDFVQREMQGMSTMQPHAFSEFTTAVSEQVKSAASREFWQAELESFSGSRFPALPSEDYVSCASECLSYDIEIVRQRGETTQATSIQAALALLIARWQCETDILFGMTVHGRDLPDCPNAEDIIGPTIATFPVRVQVRHESTLDDFLQNLQSAKTRRLEHEHYGMQNIRAITPRLASVASFSTLLIIQPDLSFEDGSAVEVIERIDNGSSDFELDYPLVVECFPCSGSFKFTMTFDPSVIAAWEVEALSQQFKQLLVTIEQSSERSMLIKEMDLLDRYNMPSILEASLGNLLDVQECLHERIFDRADMWSSEDAVEGWDAQYTYDELKDLVITKSRLLVALFKGKCGKIVPICYSKSAACVVVMLAVLASGNGFVMLDPSLPKLRLQYMVENAGSEVILCTPATEGFVTHISAEKVNVEALFQDCSDLQPWPLDVKLSPDMPCYCMYTSGSTGSPKGVLLLHKQVVSGLQAQCDMGLFTRKTRVFQFSSYSFDTCIADIFATLLAGGCICIPKEEERLTQMAENINNFSVDEVDLTPSVTNLLHPDDVPNLKVLRFGGEPVHKHHMNRWRGRCRLQNVYGPTECCVQCVFVEYGQNTAPSVIGKSINCNTWVVDPNNRKFLMPHGAVGELAIQGPAVASGYINDPIRTAQVFHKKVPWLDTYAICCEYPTYFTGDLVRFNEHGQLVFVGRKDNQIKIRGQRIELEEIEHVLRLDDSIDQAVVSYPVTGALSSELVAALVPAQSHISADPPNATTSAQNMLLLKRAMETATEHLPKYMVPTVYIVSREPLLMSSGKVNRRSVDNWLQGLTADDLNALQLYCADGDSVDTSSTPVAIPDDQAASMLAHIKLLLSWRSNQSEDGLSAFQSFSRLGLDSITLVSLLKWINKTHDVKLSMQKLLSLGTVHKVLMHLRGSDTSGSERRRYLHDVVDQGVQRLLRPRYRNIFITGASSLVGANLVVEFLHHMPHTNIMALVRCRDSAQGKIRLLDKLRMLSRWEDAFTDRIVVYPGDLSRPRLGLSDAHWSQLGGTSNNEQAIDCVVHNGAAVDWFGDFDTLKRVNVDASLDLIEQLMHSEKPNRLIYVSGGPQWDPSISANAVLRGDGLEEGTEHWDTYGQTKAVASAIIQRSASKFPKLAAKVAIVRPAFMIGSSVDGVPNMDDFIWRVVSSCYSIRAYPIEQEDSWLYAVAADKFANLVMEKLPASPQALESRIENGMTIDKFWQTVNHVLGGRLEPVNYDTWLDRLQRNISMQEASSTSANPCAPILHIISSSRQVLGAPPPPSVSQEWLRQTEEETEKAVAKNVQYMLDSGCFTEQESVWSKKVFNRRK